VNVTRRHFLQASTAAGPAYQVVAAQPKRPNIIFIMTDDQRFDDLGCMGNPVIQTPNVDRLAEQGIRFDNAFVTTAICCCSRATVLTGQNTWRHGIQDFDTPLSACQLEKTYPVLLREAGYRTAFLGKFGVGRDHFRGQQKVRPGGTVDAQGLAPGSRSPSLALPSDRFDYWFGFDQGINFLQVVNGQKRHLTPLMTEHAIEFIRSGPAERPFCVSLSFKEPHGPFNFFDPALPDTYKDVDIPAPPTFTQADFESQPEFLRKSLNGTSTGQWPSNARERFLREARTAYRLVSGVDHAVGRIMGVLRELKLDDNTVVIFTSDNGSLRGAHGLSGKWLMHEESIRVPLIIRDPRLPARLRGSRREQMALNIDFAPTMLRLGGVPVPPVMQGRDLGPLLSGSPVSWRDDWHYEHTYVPENDRPLIARSEGVRGTRWKYIRYIDPRPRYEELFDLVNDPLERHNLANSPEHKQTLAALRTRWDQIRREQ
jgi:arylsulfatase A-like enzyme